MAEPGCVDQEQALSARIRWSVGHAIKVCGLGRASKPETHLVHQPLPHSAAHTTRNQLAILPEPRRMRPNHAHALPRRSHGGGTVRFRHRGLRRAGASVPAGHAPLDTSPSETGEWFGVDIPRIELSLARGRSGPQVVEDEEPRPGEALDELGMRSVAPGGGELVEEAGDAVVARRDAETARLVAERARPVGEHGLAAPDPLRGPEALDESAAPRTNRPCKRGRSMILLGALMVVPCIGFRAQRARTGFCAR